MTDHWADSLSDYMDGTLDADDRARVEHHLAGCEDCRRTLDGLTAIVARAASLGVQEPATDLWPGILDRIRAEHTPVIPIRAAAATDLAAAVPLPESRSRHRRLSFSVGQLAAAAVLAAFVSGGAVWLALRNGAPAEPMFVEATEPTVAPADSATVQFAAMREYDDAIDQLEQELALARDRLDPETIAVIERNLAVIDAAIAEARQALAGDPSNPFLYRHLDNTLMKKIDILRRVTTIGRGAA